MKKLITLSAIISLGVLFSGCGSNSCNNTPTPSCCVVYVPQTNLYHQPIYMSQPIYKQRYQETYVMKQRRYPHRYIRVQD